MGRFIYPAKKGMRWKKGKRKEEKESRSEPLEKSKGRMKENKMTNHEKAAC